MAKPFDSSTKFLVEGFPKDWLALAGLDAGDPVDLIDANLSTITAEADKVIRIGGPTPWLVHVELQANRDPQLVPRLFRYNALLDDRHALPTWSVVVLLRPDADGPELTGESRRSLSDGREYLIFRYEILRVWRQPVQAFLNGGLGTLPLALVSDRAGMSLDDVVAAMAPRIDREPPSMRSLLWNSTAILMGLEYPSEVIKHTLRGVRDMKESSWYQMILAEGLAEGQAIGLAEGLAEGQLREAKTSLLFFAERRFGPISADDRVMIDAMTEVDRLREWTGLVFEASSWSEFRDQVGNAGPVQESDPS